MICEDPRKIFTALKRDTAKFKRPSDEQGDVFDAWYGKRGRTDNTLKMNTGSGKTVVGLLCLQSSLNEGVGPAVYVIRGWLTRSPPKDRRAVQRLARAQ
jgi:replicative superfamily II helicase